jgi:hypothetical protein
VILEGGADEEDEHGRQLEQFASGIANYKIKSFVPGTGNTGKK